MRKYCGRTCLFLRRPKPIQSVQQVTNCQDSTHLLLEPYLFREIFEQIFYNHQQQLQFVSFTVFPASKSTGQAIRVKCLEESRYSSRQTPWKRCPKYSSLLTIRSLKILEGVL